MAFPEIEIDRRRFGEHGAVRAHQRRYPAGRVDRQVLGFPFLAAENVYLYPLEFDFTLGHDHFHQNAARVFTAV